MMHQRHTARQWHKFKTRANCALSPFMYECIWGMRFLDNLINIYVFIYSIMSPRHKLMSLGENSKKT